MSISNQTGADDRKGSQIQDLALDYLTVKGFRSIKAIDKLRLQPLNVLIGANGSGKSNLLAVFRLLREMRQGNLVQYTDANGGDCESFTLWIEGDPADRIGDFVPR